jgi:hypothetical protein
MIAELGRWRLADKVLPACQIFEAVDALSANDQKWTAWTGIVLPHSDHDNENDSGIP